MLLTSINRLHTTLSEYSTFSSLAKNCSTIWIAFFYSALKWGGTLGLLWLWFQSRNLSLGKVCTRPQTYKSQCRTRSQVGKQKRIEKTRHKKEEWIVPRDGLSDRDGDWVCVCVTAWPDLKGSKRLLTRCSGLWLKLQHAAKWQENKLKMCEA